MTDSSSSHDEVLRREALAWLTRIALGEASSSDMEELRRWRDTSPAHAAALARVGRLWRGIEGAAAGLVQSGAVSVPVSSPAGYRPSRRVLLGAGAMATAAAAAGVLVVRPPYHLWPSLAELGADYRTTIGEQRRVSLSGSISVEMNTQTSIATPSVDRIPSLELIAGEVAVTVAQAAEREFVITAGAGRITTSHGVFTLRRDGAAVALTCLEGSAHLDCEGQSVTLGAGKRVVYDTRGPSEIGVANPETAAWREGMLVFRDTPLADVINEVNRYRAGRIVLLDSALGRRTVNARFELNRLDTVMSQIRHVFKAPVKTFPGGFVLVG